MAIDRVERKAKQHRLTKDQFDQIKERKRTEEAAAETAFRTLYTAVWLPRPGSGGALDLEKVEIGGRPLQATGIHERVMELLRATGTPKIHGTLHPKKVTERVRLGEPRAEGEPPQYGVATKDVRDAFFGIPDPPRILSDDVLRASIVRGVNECIFAYTTGSPALGPDSKYQVDPAKVAIGRQMSEDEVDLDNGLLMVPDAVPSCVPVVGIPTAPTSPATVGPAPITGQPPTPSPTPPAGKRTAVRISFPASRQEVFKSFQAIANLADKSDGGKINLVVQGQATAGFDPTWLRNAVLEPLEEADIEGLQAE
jgi:hypothetical protein